MARMLVATSLGSALLLTSSVARTAPEGDPGATIAVTPLQIEGEMSAEAVAKLELALSEGLQRSGVAIIPPSETALGGATLPCNGGASCIATIAAASGATHVLEVVIVKSGRDYSLEMTLSSGSDGSVQAKSSQTCEICGLQELGELIGDQAAAFQPKLEAVPATLVIETTPAGATVEIDGRRVGVTPIVEPVKAGEHVLTISKPGYHDRERTLVVVAGEEQTVSLDLQPLPVPVQTEPEPDGRGMRISGWSLLGAGVGALGAGVTLLVLDERPVGSRCELPENIDVNGLCRYRYNTLAAGIAASAAGGALLITGAVLVGLGYKKKKRVANRAEQARVRPTATGLQIRF